MKALVTITCPKDYGWLRHSAKSIERFMTGFDRWFLWVPNPKHESVERTQREYHGKVPLEVRWFDEWPGKGMMHRENIIVHSDLLHGSQYATFTNLDADMVITRPMDAGEFFVKGRPRLPVRDIIPEVAAAAGHWHRGVRDAIGIYPDTDGMGWLPLTYERETLHKTRELIQKHTRKSAEAYIRSCRNEYPQTFAEFNTLSFVAWNFFRSRYEFSPGMPPWGQRTILHFWSHGGIDRPMNGAPWTVNGKSFNTPREILADLGFL